MWRGFWLIVLLILGWGPLAAAPTAERSRPASAHLSKAARPDLRQAKTSRTPPAAAPVTFTPWALSTLERSLRQWRPTALGLAAPLPSAPARPDPPPRGGAGPGSGVPGTQAQARATTDLTPTDAKSQPAVYDDQGRQILEIAVMAIRGPEQTLKQWKATADYLTEAIPDYRFVIKPLDFESFRRAMANGDVNFVFTNPGMYVEFEALYGVRRVVTLKNKRLGAPYTEFGAVIFRRADRTDIQTARDLKGKRFATVDQSAFGGWQMAWRQLLELGIDPYRDFAKLYSAGTHDQVVYEVLEGRADAGNVRTDTLERMAQEGKIKLEDFALVHENTDYGERFPFRLSTRLYPEWPFAILPNTPQELGEQVAVALIRLRPESEAAQAGKYVGWTVPANYEPVHETLRLLRVTPYEHYGEVTWRAALEKYWHLVLGVSAGVLMLALAVIWFRRLNQRLVQTQTQLQEELGERRKAERGLAQTRDKLQVKNTQLETTNDELAATLAQVQQMQQQIIVQEKMASLGALTAGIAHEIKNPLNFIVNFSELSSELADELETEIAALGPAVDGDTSGLLTELIGDLKSNAAKIHHHGKRADSIVRNMLDHSRGKSGEFHPTDLNALLDESVNLAYHGKRATDSAFNVTIERDYDPAVGELDVVPQDLNRVFLNIVNNACYAVYERDKHGEPGYSPTLRVTTRRTGDRIEVRIRDNGTGIPQALLDKLFQPFFTTKPAGSGTGLGLSISYEIVVQEHGGTLQVDSREGHFTEFLIQLPSTRISSPADGTHP